MVFGDYCVSPNFLLCWGWGWAVIIFCIDQFSHTSNHICIFAARAASLYFIVFFISIQPNFQLTELGTAQPQLVI